MTNQEETKKGCNRLKINETVFYGMQKPDMK